MDRSQLLIGILADMAELRSLTRRQYKETLYEYSSALDKVITILRKVESVTIMALAKSLGTTSGAATQHVIALEQLGLVARRPNESDRRETFVSLAASGKAAHKKILRKRVAVMGQVFDQFSDGELEQLSRLIHKLRSTNEGDT
jgi:DNA-binding MarR family transcriptional regulator